jgi:hypothetical protein
MEKGLKSQRTFTNVCPHLMKSPTSLRTLHIEVEKNNELEWGGTYNLLIKKASCKIQRLPQYKTLFSFYSLWNSMRKLG